MVAGQRKGVLGKAVGLKSLTAKASCQDGSPDHAYHQNARGSAQTRRKLSFSLRAPCHASRNAGTTGMEQSLQAPMPLLHMRFFTM